MAPDGKMFDTTSRKGELFELREQLNANTAKDRKLALKRVVAAMSLGRDMSSLFPDVVKNTTGDISMKKLVYLYIINYAQANADLSILIVNTFIKDSVDPNPLIRALAIRTMALVPLDKITEYLCNPLHAALKDSDPYVRKTAAVCVAKLYDTNPTLAVEEGFISALQNLISDGNPMTVANAVAALSEIAEASQTPSLLPLNSKTVPRFLSALSECTEWGQVFILDAISSYIPTDSQGVDNMVERILPRLQHVNPAVVLAAIRVVTNLMPRLDAEEKRSFLVKKMSAPLITLLKSEPELQYTVLRNVSLLLRSFPSLLSSDVRVLFISYSDPPYVKSEKLDALVQIVDESNCKSILDELLEYVGEVDVWFSQRSVDTIARIALRLPSMVQECVSIFSNLLSRKVPHLTEQITIAAKDITRAYPKQISPLLSQLCESVEDVDDPSAKSALVWIIGEHSDQLPSSIEMLEIISSNVKEESINVQLQIMTAVVKALLLCGENARNMVNFVIKYATEESSDLDIRDRGQIYSRLVTLGLDAMRKLIMSEKPPIAQGSTQISAELHKELLSSLSTVAVIYQKPPNLFEGMKERAPIGIPTEEGMGEEDLLGLDAENGETEDSIFSSSTVLDASSKSSVEGSTPKELGSSLLDDLLGTSSTGSKMNPGTISLGENLNEQGSMKLILSRNDGRGLEIHGHLRLNSHKQMVINAKFLNSSNETMSDFGIQLNKNMFGIALSQRPHLPQSIPGGSSKEVDIFLEAGGAEDRSKGLALQIAIKFTPGGVLYFSMDVSSDLDVLLSRTDTSISKSSFLNTWPKIPDSSEMKKNINLPQGQTDSLETISKSLEPYGIFTVAKKNNSNPRVIYTFAKLIGSRANSILAEISFPRERRSATIASRTTVDREIGVTVLEKFNDLCINLLTR